MMSAQNRTLKTSNYASQLTLKLGVTGIPLLFPNFPDSLINTATPKLVYIFWMATVGESIKYLMKRNTCIYSSLNDAI